MHWILDNLQLLIFIAGAVAWWLNQRAREKAGESADYDADGTPEARPRGGFEDPELAERTRKIREEIQRKIAERRRAAGAGGYTEAPRPAAALLEPPPVTRQSEPPPIIREVVVQMQGQTQGQVQSQARQASVMSSRRAAEILQQQAALADQLKQAEEMKAATQRRVAYEERVNRDSATAARAATRGSLLHELHGADSLRRAFILREVLGPPVGLR